MRWIYRSRLRLRSIFRRSACEAELCAEFQDHLDRQIEHNVARGMDAEEARFAALRAMDGVEQRKEECRDRRRSGWFDRLAQDLCYALRILRRKPGFTIAAVLSLALGIGANTAVFSVMNTLLLTKLPVRDPDGLYQLIATRRTGSNNSFSYANFQKLQSGLNLFQVVAIWNDNEWQFESDQTRTIVHGSLASGSFYDVLGVRPALGRLFTNDDDGAGGASVAVLGYGFWQRQYSGDPAVIGKTIRIEGSQFTVIGVTQEGFGGAEINYPRDITLPVHALKRLVPSDTTLDNPGSYAFRALVRLKSGVSMAAAQSVLGQMWPRLEEGEAPMAYDNWKPKLQIVPGAFGVSGARTAFSQALIVVMALVGIVLLMMCANLASLLLARALSRRKEIAVRLAMGAGRWRLIRQSLTEALLLAACGGAAALALAKFLTQALLLFLPGSNFLNFHLDLRILLFASAVSLAAALLIGSIPAFQLVRVPLSVAMSEAGRSAGLGRRSPLTRAIVAIQVAISMVLVIGSLLFVRSLQNLSNASLGFNRAGLYLMDVNMQRAGIHGPQTVLLSQRMQDELNATPGVASASLTRIPPLSGGIWWDSAVVPGHALTSDESATVYMNQVAPGYFRTLEIPVLQGREFATSDDRGSPRVAIINQSFARHFFEGRNPVGTVINLGYGIAFANNPRYAAFRNLEIVGVVADSKYFGARESQKDLIYLASYQTGQDLINTFVIRMAAGSVPGAAVIRTVANRFAAGADLDIRPYSQVFERTMQTDRMVAALSGIFGLAGLLLACVGLYGIMAQSVAARTGEIGIRMTLGARASVVQMMILRDALWLLAAGAAVGLPLSFAAVRLTRGMLFNTAPSDPRVLTGSILVMGVVGLLAAWLPARRASKIDPMASLRHD